MNKYSEYISQSEAEILLCHIFKCSRLDLYISDISVDEQMEGLYDSLIQRRLCSEPIQYIIGFAEFMGLDFIVNKDVFIPRPETELLVDTILSSPFTLHPSPKHRLTILDLCTGCGNIAISLAKLIPNAEVVATDVSEAAISVARKNSILHDVEEKVMFCKGDLFQALLIDKKNKFDIIVCNPPYIKSKEIDFLQEEVKREPRIALDGGGDGLDFYRRIAGEAHDYLNPGGSVFLEIGAGQAQDAGEIFNSKGAFEICKIIKDFAGIERLIWTDLL